MADPATLAIASIGSTIAGGITGAMGAQQQGKAQAYQAESQAQSADAQSRMYTYQASVAAVNQKIARDNATYAMAVGEQQAMISGMKTRAQIATTKASQGASGIDVNSGSAVDVRASEAELGDFEQENVRHSAQRTAYGYQLKETEAKQQETLYGMAAEDSSRAAQRIRGAKGMFETAADINSMSSILGSAGSVSDKWLKFGAQGVPGFGVG